MTWCGPACLCVNNHSQQPRSSEFAEQTIVDSRDWLSVFFYGCVQFDHLEYQGGVGHISATRKGRFLTLPLRVSFSWLERWNPVREGNHLPPPTDQWRKCHGSWGCDPEVVGSPLNVPTGGGERGVRPLTRSQKEFLLKRIPLCAENPILVKGFIVTPAPLYSLMKPVWRKLDLVP